MDLLCNPFYILAASTQDSGQRIMDLVDRCSLVRDPVKCREAAATLTHPRRRLRAEIAWLPVKNSEQAENLCGLLESSEGTLGALDSLRQTQNLLGTDELMPIAKCNVLATGMCHMPRHSSDDVETWILELAWASEDIDAEQTRTVINEDRKTSGFPVVNLPHMKDMKKEILMLQEYYLRVMTSVLKNLSGKERAVTVTDIIESATDSLKGKRTFSSFIKARFGVVESATDEKKQFPRLIDRLVDWYELDAHKSLKEQESKIDQLDKKLRLAADRTHQDSTLASLVNQLTDAINDWHTVAQPIQINKKNKGLPHKDSKRVKDRVRGLALHLLHDYNKLSFCQQLIVTLEAAFADVVEISEALTSDLNQLENIAQRRGQKALDEFTRIRGHCALQDVMIQLQNLRSAACANKSKFSISRMANRLILSVKKWKHVAQPISASNTDYRNIANSVRELALYLRSVPGNLNTSLRLLRMHQKEFAEIDEDANLVVEDGEVQEGARRDIKAQIRKLRAAAVEKKPDFILGPMVIQLIQAVKKWKALAQPIKAYSTDDVTLVHLVMELAFHLRIPHGKLDFSRLLLKTLQEEFTEDRGYATSIAEYSHALEAAEHALGRITIHEKELRVAAVDKKPDSDLEQLVNQLIQAVKEWRTKAQPIKAYYANYSMGVNLVKELALDLKNEHRKLANSRQLLKMLQQEFAEIDEIAALVTEHLDALEAADSARRHIEIQVKGLRDAVYAKHYHPDLRPMVNQLVQSVIAWRDLAQPINAYYGEYCGVAKLVSELALSLKKKGKLRSYRQLKKMRQDIFGKIPEIDTLLAEEPKAQDEAEKKYVRRNTRKRARWRR